MAIPPYSSRQIAARKRGRRIRSVASTALAVIVVTAGTRYVIQMRAAGRTLEDLMPGSEAARAREVSILIGSFGESLLEAWRFVQQPGTQALLIVAVAFVGTLLCFRVAALIERYADEDENRSR